MPDPRPSPVEASIEALKDVIATIRHWHGMVMPKRAEAEAWALYQQSPEMKRASAALARLERLTCERTPAATGASVTYWLVSEPAEEKP